MTGRAAGPLRRLSQPGTLSLTGVQAAPATRPGSHASSSQGANKSAAAVARPGGVMVQAAGSMAGGLEAEQTAGGVATARCGGPGTDFWFAVPGQQPASTIELDLMNVDSQASTVDVDVFTDTGPLHTGADTGITVPAHGLVVQSLAGLVHGSRAIALHVRTSAGRVVAALRESCARATARGNGCRPRNRRPSAWSSPECQRSRGARVLYLADAGRKRRARQAQRGLAGRNVPADRRRCDRRSGGFGQPDRAGLAVRGGRRGRDHIQRSGHRGRHPHRRPGRARPVR